MHDRVKPFLCKAVAVLFGLPHIEVAEPAFGSLHHKMDDEALGRLGPELFDDAPIKRSVDGHVLRERVSHNSPLLDVARSPQSRVRFARTYCPIPQSGCARIAAATSAPCAASSPAVVCSRALIGEPLQPGALTFRGSIRSAPYGGTMADESDNAAIGDQLLIALAALRAIAQAVPAADAMTVLDETEAEVFWRDWPEVRTWTEALWQRLDHDLAQPAQPQRDAELDEVGEGD